MTLLTGEQEEERENTCNYYDSHIFTSQTINEEPASRSISPVRNSSTADDSAAAAQGGGEYYDRLESKDSRKYWDIIT